MAAKKIESLEGVGTSTKAFREETLTVSHIRIIPHRKRKRKQSFRQIAVKGITFGAFLTNLYAIMLMEFHPQIGVPLFGVTFLYELAFLKSNGGL